MKIAIGCDHAGVELKEVLIQLITQLKHDALDKGPFSSDSVDYPDYGHAVAMAVDEEGYTWRVGQFRFPLNAYSWEIPEGGGPLGINPLESAKRELQEEVGYAADEWTEFLHMDLSNSVTNERAVVFLAESLTFLGTSHEDTENLRLERLHFSTLYNQVLNGSIRDSISVAAVLKLAIIRPDFLEIKK